MIIKLKAEGQNLIKFPELVGIYTDISVFNNQIEAISAALWHQKELKVLNLSANKIRYISGDIENLSELEMIDLGHNNISVLPAGIGSLP